MSLNDYLAEVEARAVARGNGHDEYDRWLCEVALDITKLTALVREMRGALEACTGGDLASGEGIYKAEVAREALAKCDAIAEKPS